MFSKSKQVRLVGNRVDPVQGAAHIRANVHGALDVAPEPMDACRIGRATGAANGHSVGFQNGHSRT